MRRLREAKGWTQDRLARALTNLGTPATQSTVTRIEKGTRPLRLNEAEALARALGVAIEGLWRAPVLVPVEVAELKRHVDLLRELAAQAVKIAEERDEAWAQSHDWEAQAIRHQARLSQHLSAIEDLRKPLQQLAESGALQDNPDFERVYPRLFADFEAEYGQRIRKLMALDPISVEF